MTRLAMSALFGHLGHVAFAAQSQIPLRTGDCVYATQTLDFFYKDEGEYERTHRIDPGQSGVLLNLGGNGADDASTVEFIDPYTREPVVEGAVFMHQFARMPWQQGVVAAAGAPTLQNIQGQPAPVWQAPPKYNVAGGKLTLAPENVCMTAKDGKDGYQPVVRMSKCFKEETDKETQRETQQFSWRRDSCGAGPIRYTKDPSKCVDAVHPNKILLTDCAGIDSQKFQFRCKYERTAPGQPEEKHCYVLAMGGRKDMCLWYDAGIADSDLQIRSCNFDAKSQAPSAGIGATSRFFTFPRVVLNPETRPNTAPTV